MGQSNHWGFCLVFCFFCAVILNKRMSSPIFCPYGFIALQKKSLVAVQRCWFLWQRKQQAYCSAHFRCSKIPLCGRRAWHSKGITHSGVQQWCRRTIPPVEAHGDSLSLLPPFLHLQAIATAMGLSSDADLCCPCFPMKKPNKIIIHCYLKPNGNEKVTNSGSYSHCFPNSNLQTSV